MDRMYLVPSSNSFVWSPTPGVLPKPPPKEKSYADRQREANEEQAERVRRYNAHIQVVRSQASKRRFELSRRISKNLAKLQPLANKPPTIATVTGIVIPFDRIGYPQDGSTEVIAAGALDEQLSGSSDVFLAIGHDGRAITRRSEFGIWLSTEPRGLWASIDVPDAPRGKQFLRLVRSPEFAGWSFTIDYKRSRYTTTQIGGREHCRFSKMFISELCAVAAPNVPAYPLVARPLVTLHTLGKRVAQ